jgi:hypothetical protein
MPSIAEIRQQYPQYADMSDEDLADRLHQKFYADMPRDEFDLKAGIVKVEEPSIADSLARQAGLTGRAVARGVGTFGDIANTITNLGIAGINKVHEAVTSPTLSELIVGRQPLIKPLPMLTDEIDRSQVFPKPENATERWVGRIGEEVVANALPLAPARVLARGMPGAAPTVTQNVSRLIADSPATDLAVGVGAGVAGQAADELAPDSPMARLLAPVLGGVVGGVGFAGAARAIREAVARRQGVAPEAIPEDIAPADLAVVLADENDLLHVARGAGIESADDPRLGVLRERLAARREAEAVRPADPQAVDIDQVRAQQEAVAAGEMDPAAASLPQPRAPLPEVIRQGEQVAPPVDAPTQAPPYRVPGEAIDPGTQAGFEANGGRAAVEQKSLPSPDMPAGRPTEMTPEQIAQAQARGAAEAAPPRVAEGVSSPPERLVVPTERAPQTPEQVQGQREAGEAFRAAEVQRDRAGAEVRDTQPAARPEGANAQSVMIDDGFPVQVVSRTMEPDARGRVVEVATVRRYDPRTGQPEADAVDYKVPVRDLKSSQYAAQPRQAQDFVERAKAPAAPELPRTEAQPVRREPAQTYRATDADPNTQFPGASSEGPGAAGARATPDAPPDGGPGPAQGRSPIPEQAAPGEGARFKDWSAAEAEFRAREQYRQEAGAKAREKDAGQRAREQAEQKYQKTRTSNRPQDLDADQRYPIDEFGFVRSDKGGPIKFSDQKQAARWIVGEGQKKSVDQHFEIENHPSGGFTVRERGRNPGPGGEPPKGAKSDTKGPSDPPQGGQTGRSTAAEPVRTSAGDRGGAERATDAASDGPRAPSDDAPKPSGEKAPKLVVARRMDDGSVVYGKPGEMHAALVRDGEQFVGNNKVADQMGFAEPGGPFMSRREALDFTRKNEPERSKVKYEKYGLEGNDYLGGPEGAARVRRDAEANEKPHVAEAGDVIGHLTQRSATFYSNPIGDPQVWKSVGRLIGRSSEWLTANVKDSLTSIAEIKAASDPSKGVTRNVIETPRYIARALLMSNDGRLRSLARRTKIKEFEEIADLVQPTGTAGREAVGRGYQEAFHARVRERHNEVSNILGKLAEDRGAMQQVRKMVLAGQSNDTPIGKAAAAVTKMLKEELDYRRAGGVETGQTKNYFPRMLDTLEVVKTANQFEKELIGEYRKTGLARADAEAAAKEMVEKILSSQAGADALDFQAFGKTARSEKARSFGPSADTSLAPWLVKDPVDALMRYIASTTKRVELAKRFGAENEKIDGLIKGIIEKGGREFAGEAISAWQAATGQLRADRVNGRVQNFLSWVRVEQTLGLLEKAAISSVNDLIGPMIRSGKVSDLPKVLAGYVKQMSGHGIEARERAEILGIIGKGYEGAMMARSGVEPTTRMQELLMRKFFLANLLEQHTHSVRVANLGLLEAETRTYARDIMENRRGKGVAARRLEELGIPRSEQKGFSQWLLSSEDLPDAKTVRADEGFAGMYRTAMIRGSSFIIDPNAALKPWLASHPVGGLVFHLQSFNYAFTKMLYRIGGEVYTAATNKNWRTGEKAGLDPLERLAVAKVALALPVMYAVGYGVQAGRDEAGDAIGELLTGHKAETRKEKTALEKVMEAGSRAGIFGALDPVINAISNTRYGKDPLVALLGPTAGTLSSTMKTVLAKDSDRTFTKERNLAGAAYSLFVEPAVNAGISLTSPSPWLSFALMAGGSGNPAIKNAWQTMWGGPATPKPQSGGSATPGGRTGRESSRSTRQSTR